MVNLSKEKHKYHLALQETVNKLSHLVAKSNSFNMFCQCRLNVRNLYACGTLADVKPITDTLRISDKADPAVGSPEIVGITLTRSLDAPCTS